MKLLLVLYSSNPATMSTNSQSACTTARNVNGAILFTIAAWLIVNSHLEKFYPIAWLAADGLLGNSLFFFVSGYGIQKTLLVDRRWKRFFSRRLIRIYPAIFLVLIAQISIQYPDQLDLSNVFYFFVWPTQYTYIKFIIPFYAALWMFSNVKARLLVLSLIASVIFYIFSILAYWPLENNLSLGALPQVFWFTFFWCVTASGALWARKDWPGQFSVGRLALVAAAALVYFAAKLMAVLAGLIPILFPLLHILCFALIALMFWTLSDPELVSKVTGWPLVGWIIALTAPVTLELYICHEVLLRVTELEQRVWFPLSLVVFAIASLAFAWCVHWVCKLVIPQK